MTASIPADPPTPQPDASGKRAAQRPTLAFPPVLNVEVTNDCNLDCPMCARTTSMTRPVQHMTEATFQRAIDEAHEHGVAKLWLHMFGESLLHPQIYDFIAYASRKTGIKLVALSTNVTPLTPKNSRRLLESGLHHLILSVDAQSEDVYKAVRGFDFQRVLTNARAFLELHRETGSSMSVNLSIINMGIKRDEIDAFQREWASFGSDRVKVLVKKLINFGGLVDTRQFTGDAEVTGLIRLGGARKSCPKLFDSLTIQSNGEIVACCYDVNGSMSYGNIGQTTLLEAWQGGAIGRLRSAHEALDFSRLPLCQSCDSTFKMPKGKAAVD